MRVGIGWDRHRLLEGRPCVLGGVLFEDAAAGPVGHSDGDAVVHAVIDALLGAAALGDIGRHFPDTDPAYADIDSLKLLADTRGRLAERGFGIMNIDTTVIAEAPKIAARAGEMAGRMAAVLEIDPAMISIKATRGEGLGPEGRAECVTVQAIALLSTGHPAGRRGPPDGSEGDAR